MRGARGEGGGEEGVEISKGVEMDGCFVRFREDLEILAVGCVGGSGVAFEGGGRGREGEEEGGVGEEEEEEEGGASALEEDVPIPGCGPRIPAAPAVCENLTYFCVGYFSLRFAMLAAGRG